MSRQKIHSELHFRNPTKPRVGANRVSQTPVNSICNIIFYNAGKIHNMILPNGQVIPSAL